MAKKYPTQQKAVQTAITELKDQKQCQKETDNYRWSYFDNYSSNIAYYTKWQI